MAALPKKHPKKEPNKWAKGLHQLLEATGDPEFLRAYERLRTLGLAELRQRDATRRLKGLHAARRGRMLAMMAEKARRQLAAKGERPSNRKVHLAVAIELGLPGGDGSDARRKWVERALMTFRKIRPPRVRRYALATQAERQAMLESRRRWRERQKATRLGRQSN